MKNDPLLQIHLVNSTPNFRVKPVGAVWGFIAGVVLSLIIAGLK